MLRSSDLGAEVFRRFAAMYGAQKVRSQWEGADGDLADAQGVWGSALAHIAPGVLEGAFGEIIRSGSEWPPSLPQFVETCRQVSIAKRQESDAKRLGYSGRSTEVNDTEREALKSVAESANRDPLYWAKHPKSALAVRMLVEASRRPDGVNLRPILRDLMRDPSPCRSEEARRTIELLRNAA